MKYHSKKEALEYIEKLKKIKWEAYNGEDSQSYLDRYHKEITTITEYFTVFYVPDLKGILNEKKFFRIRKVSDVKNPTDIRDHSFPPSNVCNNLRANLAGFPVLYTSEFPLLSVLEYLQQWENKETFKEDEFWLSVWSLKPNEKMNFICPYIPDNLRKINKLGYLSNVTYEIFKKMTNDNISEDEIEGMLALRNYFAEEFITDSKRSISSYIGYKSLYSIPQGFLPILLYPSVKLNNVNNFVFHQDFATYNMQIDRVYKIKIKAVESRQEGIDFNYDVYNNVFIVNINSELKIVDPNFAESNLSNFKKMYKMDFGQELNI